MFYYRSTVSALFLFESRTGSERPAPCKLSPLSAFFFCFHATEPSHLSPPRSVLSSGWRGGGGWWNHVRPHEGFRGAGVFGLNSFNVQPALLLIKDPVWLGLHVLLVMSLQEPSHKRVKPVVKSNSLTGVITPSKTPALKRIGQSISVTNTKLISSIKKKKGQSMTWACRHSPTGLFPQRSISFRTEARPLPPAPMRPRTKASSFPRRRNSQCWSDTVESHDLTAKEIKRQEVWGGGLYCLCVQYECVFGLEGMWVKLWGCGAAGAAWAGTLPFISVKQLFTEITKEDVSWQQRLNFLYWTISCRSSCCSSVCIL